MSITYLYLDQRDLIDLSNDKNPAIRKKLDELLSSKRVKIILSFMHVIETWKYADRAERKKVAAYADSLFPLWIIDRDLLFKEEIRSVLWEYLGVQVVYYWPSQEDKQIDSGLLTYPDGRMQYQFCPFRKSLKETSRDRLENISEQKTSGHSDSSKSFTDMLTKIENNPRIPQMLVELHQAYPELTKLWREKFRGPLPGRDKHLKFLVSQAYDTSILSGKIRYDFLRWLDINIKKCPSIYSYYRIKDEINKDKLSTPHPSQMVDIVHLHAFPYCDAFSTDKRIWDYIRRCNLKKNFWGKENTRMMCAFKSLPDAIEWIESHADS